MDLFALYKANPVAGVNDEIKGNEIRGMKSSWEIFANAGRGRRATLRQ